MSYNSKASALQQPQDPQKDSSSSQPPAYSSPAFRTTFGSVSLHMSDRIRFVQLPPEDIAVIKNTIQRSWAWGIQAERPYSVSYEFKLRGSPWSGSGTGSYAVPALILMREVFASLYSMGWIMTASTDISRKKFDKDTLIFRKQPVPPPAATWTAISFKTGDKLRFLGAPPELIAAFSTLLKNMKLLQSEAVKDPRLQYHEFKLYGYPWAATGEETMKTRVLILKLVELLELHGWSLYASIDQNSGPSGDSNYSETDSWYCVKSSDWRPGSIILHR